MVLPVVPVMRAYKEMRDTHGFARSLDLVAAMSANGPAYLATPARVHEGWARAVYQTREPKDSLFPGVVAVLLAAAGLALWRDGLRDPRLRIAIILTTVGVILSFGPATPFYSAFYWGVPFASSVRALWKKYRPKSNRLAEIGSPSTRTCFSGRCQPRGRTSSVAVCSLRR